MRLNTKHGDTKFRNVKYSYILGNRNERLFQIVLFKIESLQEFMMKSTQKQE